jgi:hypothetical protein
MLRFQIARAQLCTYSITVPRTLTTLTISYSSRSIWKLETQPVRRAGNFREAIRVNNVTVTITVC